MSVFYKHWYGKGIYKIAHVMDDSKNLLSFENFQAKFLELECNYLEYQGKCQQLNILNVFWNLEKKMLLIIFFNKTR